MSYNGSSDPPISGVNVLPTIPESLPEVEQHDEDTTVSDPLANTSFVAYEKLTVTEVFVKRMLYYLDTIRRQRLSSAVLPEDEQIKFFAIVKYFKNLRNKRMTDKHIPVPSEAECLESPLGLLYGLVWDPADPSTAWPPVLPPLLTSGQLTGRSLVAAAHVEPMTAPSDLLTVLAEAASAEGGFHDRKGIDVVRSLADIQYDIQSHQADFETSGDRAARAHQEFLDKHSTALLHWELANEYGLLAHEALGRARASTVELNQHQLVHFALLREFDECCERMRQSTRDDCEK